eukprot:5478433-Prymnesium_polylepis.1
MRYFGVLARGSVNAGTVRVGNISSTSVAQGGKGACITVFTEVVNSQSNQGSRLHTDVIRPRACFGNLFLLRCRIVDHALVQGPVAFIFWHMPSSL